MRHWAVGTFLAGFASGVVFLAAMLWWSHGIQPINASPSPGSTRRAEVPAAPAARLTVPVQGIAPEAIRENFQEKRDGHAHEALDILAPRGTPVVAAADGQVAKIFHSKPGGLTVYQFDRTRNWCFYYAHLDQYASGLAEGAELRQGEVLGYVGTTGNAPANTPHLHFAVFRLGLEKRWWEGTAIDPYPYISNPPLPWPPPQ